MSIIADHRWSVFVSLEPRATKPPCTQHVAPGEELPVQEGERLQPHAASGRIWPRTGSVPPGRKLSAVKNCSEFRLPGTAANRARTDAVQNSMENNSKLPIFCCSLPGWLVKQQIISRAALYMGGFPSDGGILVTPQCSDSSSPSCSWAKTSSSEPSGGLSWFVFCFVFPCKPQLIVASIAAYMNKL